MRSIILLLVGFLSLFLISGCSGDEDVAGTSASDVNSCGLFDVVPAGPCPVTDPVGYAIEVVTDGRAGVQCPDSAWGSANNVLGAPDSVFTSLGGDAGNYLVVEMEKEFADGPGADLVVFSVDMGDAAAGYYDVYASDNGDSGFVLIDTVRAQGNWCIDLAGSGLAAGKYVKIEQFFSVPGFDTLAACSTSYGADIDAIGVLNEPDTCMTFDDLCEYVGAAVDESCPPDAEYRNHGEYVSCVAHSATDAIKGLHDDPCYDEYVLEHVHGCVVSQRAQTDIGKKKKGK